MVGQMITYPVQTPLVYELDPDYPGQLQPMYKAAAPIMREDLLDALASAGVDHLQLFDAVLRASRSVQRRHAQSVVLAEDAAAGNDR
jgi:hypothetical protein